MPSALLDAVSTQRMPLHLCVPRAGGVRALVTPTFTGTAPSAAHSEYGAESPASETDTGMSVTQNGASRGGGFMFSIPVFLTAVDLHRMRLFSPSAPSPAASLGAASDHASSNGDHNVNSHASSRATASASVSAKASASAINIARANDRAELRAFRRALELARCVPTSVRDRAPVLAFAHALRRAVCGLDAAAADEQITHRSGNPIASAMQRGSSSGAAEGVSRHASGSGAVAGGHQNSATASSAVNKLPQFDMAAAIAMAGFVPKTVLEKEPVVIYRYD